MNMGKVISFMNNKGGVGKTTSAHSIGLAWARMGNRILFIDLDSQANLTSMLSVTDPLVQSWDRTIEDAFLEGADGGDGLPVLHTEVPSSQMRAGKSMARLKGVYRSSSSLPVAFSRTTVPGGTSITTGSPRPAASP